MLVTHEYHITCKCPVDGTIDFYEVRFTTNRLLKVEKILKAITKETKRPTYQEQLTKNLSKRLNCIVETVGEHSRFKTTVICEQNDSRES